MNKTKILFIALIILVLLNLGTLSVILFHKTKPKPGEGPQKYIIEKLHFDQKQREKYANLIRVHQENIHKVDKVLKKHRQKLFHSLAEEHPENKDTLLNRICRLQKKIENIHYEHFQELKSICKPSQMNDFKELTRELAKFFSPKPKK